mgnify:CR=1 FL=1
MTPEIGELAKDIVKKILQKNTFKCRNCKTKIEYVDENKYPLFPCQGCGAVDWEVHSINDTIIYPGREP